MGDSTLPAFHQFLQVYKPNVTVVCVGLPWENPKEWRFSTNYQAWMTHDVTLMDPSVVNLLGVKLVQDTYAELGLVSETARTLIP